jgi:hypothetical protein
LRFNKKPRISAFRGGGTAKLGEGERQVRLDQDRLAIKRKQAESIYVVLPAEISSSEKFCHQRNFVIEKNLPNH